MTPALGVALLWLLFGGTHVALATGRVRAGLVARLGSGGFLALYSAVAVATFVVLVAYYATHRFAGAPGLALGRFAPVRHLLVGVAFAGVALAFLMNYPRSPTALFDQPIGPPRGVERITRHPFFAGTALLGLAHVLLATRLVGTVFFAGLATLAIAGAWHQDRKLLARRGPAYADYMAATSAVPFAAVAAARQRLASRELGLRAPLLAVVATLAIRAVHDRILADGGAWLVAAVLTGAAVSTLRAARRAHRLAARATAASGV